LVARRRDALERLAAELAAAGSRTFVAAHDLADPTRAADWIAPAEAALGPIDVLVSNAGSLTLGAIAGFDADEGERMMSVNLLSPARLMRAVLPAMLARKRGVIVNVTSMAALVALPGWIYQSASKSGSAAFSEALRGELRGSGVHVLTVYPGMTDTPMTRAGLQAYGARGVTSLIPLGKPSSFARRLRRAVQRRRARLFYPRFYGLVRWFPRLSAWMAALFAPRLR
ncbi:MAG: SDR family NAD(P)-dependent oxidoreductase, partial [Polyangia bacterium]